MTQPAETRTNPLVLAVQIVAGVVGGLATVIMFVLVAMVLRSRLSTDPATDPHGYVLIFGTMMTLTTAVIAFGLMPLAAPPGRRLLAYGVAAVVYPLVACTALVAWVTAG